MKNKPITDVAPRAGSHDRLRRDRQGGSDAGLAQLACGMWYPGLWYWYRGNSDLISEVGYLGFNSTSSPSGGNEYTRIGKGRATKVVRCRFLRRDDAPESWGHENPGSDSPYEQYGAGSPTPAPNCSLHPSTSQNILKLTESRPQLRGRTPYTIVTSVLSIPALGRSEDLGRALISCHRPAHPAFPL